MRTKYSIGESPKQGNPVSLWQWLADTEGAAMIAHAARLFGAGQPELHVLSELRRRVEPNRAAAAVEQAALAKRAEEKFSRGGQMLFTRRGLAQATSEWISLYKAARYESRTVIDLCCGVGGDLIGAALRGPARGVDADPIAQFCATHNCRAYGATRVETICQRVEDVTLSTRDVIHMDPDRRPSNERSVDLSRFEPNLSVIEGILDRVAGAGLKLAPATRLPDRWYLDYEVEWIGHQGECKQQVVWTRELVSQAGRRGATVISKHGESREHLWQETSRPKPAPIKPLAEYLIEPHSAILAAGLAWEFAAQIRGHRISPEVAYLTASRAHLSLLGNSFRVLASTPLKASAVEQLARANHWRISEIKTRALSGVDMDAFHRIKPGGADPVSLFLTRVGGKPRAIICQRIPHETRGCDQFGSNSRA